MSEESKLEQKYKDSQEDKKFSQEELDTVKLIQKKYVDIQHKLGQLSVAKLRLQQQEESLNRTGDELHDAFIDTQEEEKKFISSITEKYGDGVLDPETGIYSKSEKK